MMEIIEFRTWKRWVEQHGRCQATTTKGRQCKNPCAGMGSDICNEDDFHEVEFVLGATDRCRVHRDPGGGTLVQAGFTKETRPRR